MANRTEKLIDALEPVAVAHGLELVSVEVAGTSKNPILRVFLDSLEGGIMLDQLTEAQEWVDTILEEIDPFEYSYTLEVSSPGIDRPLRKREDYSRFAGEEVVLFLKAGESHTKVTGILKGMDGDVVIVLVGDDEERIAFDRIKRANIIGRIDFSRHDFDALDGIDTTTEDGKEK